MAGFSLKRWSFGLLLRTDWFNRLLAKHLRDPEGLFGRWVAGVMDEGNARMSERALDLLDIRIGDAILEVGFGGGPALRKMASLTGREGKAIGLERSPTMIQRGQEKFAQLIDKGRLLLVEGDVERLRFPDNHFDGISTVNTIYFWEHPAQVLAQLFRVLKYGGRLVIGFRPQETMEKLPFVNEGFTLYTPDRVRALLEQAGFTDIQFEEDKDDELGYVLAMGRKPGSSGDGLLYTLDS